MPQLLLAGATGTLGRAIARELAERQRPARLLTRSLARAADLDRGRSEIVRAEVTRPETLRGVMDGIDTVISTVGITRQRDGLTYMDVDYRANRNLLDEALRSGVRKVVFVSVLHGERLRHLKICDAKERFVDALRVSGLDYSVIRPNGFFSDLTAFLDMARRGRAYVFGDGSVRANPIHPADLAEVCVDAVHRSEREIEVGGPEVLTQTAIARLAFEALGQPPKITHVPDAVRRGALTLARTFTSSRTYGPIEFFLTVMARDMVAPQAGHRRLGDYFRQRAAASGAAASSQRVASA